MDKFFFADTYLLRGSTIGDVEAIQAIAEVREFDPDQVIVSESDENNDIMALVEGSARVESRDGALIDNLRMGSIIGEIAFLDGKGRTARVVSVGKSKMLVIPATGLKSLMKENKGLEIVILRNISQALCERLREANQQIENLMVAR